MFTHTYMYATPPPPTHTHTHTHAGLSVSELIALCACTYPQAKAFNTHGWIKGEVKERGEWSHYENDSALVLYVRVGEQVCVTVCVGACL